MALKTENILIFGATGLIGQHITNSILRNAADFGRIAIFTSSRSFLALAILLVDFHAGARADVLSVIVEEVHVWGIQQLLRSPATSLRGISQCCC